MTMEDRLVPVNTGTRFTQYQSSHPTAARNNMSEAHVLTSLEILNQGLLAVGFKQEQIDRVKHKKNLSRFRTNYCSHPRVYAHLFERLQTTDIEEAQLDCSALGLEKTLNYFFAAIYLLARYPTEEQVESTFSISGRTFRKYAWSIVGKISALFPEIVVWPDWWGNPNNPEGGETKFILTVDGTHCRIDEPTLGSFAEQRKYYSHKFRSAGLDYEVALSIYESKCVWVAGPYPAGKHDITIFRKKLKNKMVASGEANGKEYRGIGDRGYRGESSLLSVPSSQDSSEVRDFKGRAMSRQETFNSRLKHYDCLDVRFRHGIEKHALAFYACVVLVQLQMENGFPLFQV